MCDCCFFFYLFQDNKSSLVCEFYLPLNEYRFWKFIIAFKPKHFPHFQRLKNSKNYAHMINIIKWNEITYNDIITIENRYKRKFQMLWISNKLKKKKTGNFFRISLINKWNERDLMIIFNGLESLQSYPKKLVRLINCCY